MPIQVDYYDKVVYITSPTTTVTVQELVDAIRAAEDTPEGMAFGGSVATLVDAVTDAEGKASVGGGFLAGIVMTLKSDWYIEFWDGVVLGTVSGGNVTGGLANRPVRCAVGSSDTALQLGAVGGVIAETGTSGLTSEESTELFSIKSSIKGADDDDLKDISDQLDVVQADLDNPNQYKADVSALALEATAQSIKGKTDNLPADPASQAQIPGDVWDEDLSTHTTKGSASEALQIDRSVSIDTALGEAGTAWPIGTHRYPVNNLADALTIAAARNIDELFIHGTLTIGATDNVDGYQFIGHEGWGANVIFTAGCSANDTSWKYLELNGEVLSGNVMLIESCTIGTLTNFRGVMNIVAFTQSADITVDGWATILEAQAGGDPASEPEISVGTALVTISKYTGNLKIMDKTGGNRMTVGCTGGNIVIDSTCVNGTIQLLGNGHLEADNSGPGCSVDTDGFLSMATIDTAITVAETNVRGADSDDLKTLSDQLDVAQADLDDPDQYKADLTSVALEATLQLVKTETDKIPSLESLLAFISSIEGGRWRIVNNQMIFYEDDNVTEVARFNLFDSDGQPAETDVFERVRV